MASPSLPRRDFLKQTAAIAAVNAGIPSMTNAQSFKTTKEFTAYQQKRRQLLWSLLGDLPVNHYPKPPRLIKTEKGDGTFFNRFNTWTFAVTLNDYRANINRRIIK